MKERLWCSNQH